MTSDEALQKAVGVGLDLVEVSPNAEPPVCRIMDSVNSDLKTQKETGCEEETTTHSGKRN